MNVVSPQEKPPGFMGVRLAEDGVRALLGFADTRRLVTGVHGAEAGVGAGLAGENWVAAGRSCPGWLGSHREEFGPGIGW
jgi:hypothetical protein